jgi:hypothetical protein
MFLQLVGFREFSPKYANGALVFLYPRTPQLL